MTKQAIMINITALKTTIGAAKQSHIIAAIIAITTAVKIPAFVLVVWLSHHGHKGGVGGGSVKLMCLFSPLFYKLEDVVSMVHATHAHMHDTLNHLIHHTH